MKKNVTPQTIIENDVNQLLLNAITPSGIDFDSTHANLGDMQGKVYFLSKYPSEGVDYGWMAPLCNLEGTSTVVEFHHTDKAALIDVYNKKISELKSDRTLAKQESEKQVLDAAIKDLERLIKSLAVDDEPVGYVNIMLHIQDTTEKLLNDRIKRVSGRVAGMGCNIKNLKYRQIEALQCISPYGVPYPERIANMGNRNMPMSTFTGGFPMANSGINDVGGYYLGKTKQNRLIILNQWLRNKDRVNSNWIITGLPGVGKSSFIKLIFCKEIAFGTKIIVFDPEEEYVDLAVNESIKGDVIDCAGGATGRINPLQIRKSPRITKEDLTEDEKLEDFFQYDESNGISDMALHIQNLHVFFKCLFGKEYTIGIKTLLEENLIELYNSKEIYWETDISDLQPEDYPIISELYELVEKNSQQSTSHYKKDNYDKLMDLIYPHAKGSNQFMWNGPTTLQSSAEFIDLNVSKLLDMDDDVRRAQFMNLTMWSWNEASQDRTKPVLFGVDEGYLFVDPDYPELMKFLRNFSKRDRKYEAGLMFITHSVVDVLDPAVKRFGQALIDNACYKFVMGCDGKNLEETAKLFDFTETERNLLLAKNRGAGILFAGGVRLDMQVEIHPEILQMFGKAGGR